MPRDTAAGRTVEVRIDDLARCVSAVFAGFGLAPDAARGLGDLLLDSELRGHPDHGVAALGILGDFYREGRLNPQPRVRTLRETAGALLLDGDRGCGPAAPTRAMRWCVEHARAGGGAAVATIKDWQMLVGGPYVRIAAEEGMIGFACTNFVPLLAPPGGRRPVLGTNPIAYALPAGRYPAVVLDVATSVSSMQSVRVAADEGRAVPEGAVLDREGRATTNPQAFFDGGLLAPLGSPGAPHKGFGLALLVDALSGVLSGGAFARHVTPGPAAAFLGALDVEAFLPRSQFAARLDDAIEQVKEGPAAPGVDELRVPGERGDRRRHALQARGAAPLAPAAWRILSERCAELDVEPPVPSGG